MSHDKLLSDLREVWRSHGIEPSGPASPEAIAAFEAQHGVRLPDDLRAYFATLNGSMNGRDGAVIGDRPVRFWRLDQVERRTETDGPQNVFYFADFLLDSHLFGIMLSSEAATNPVVIDFGPAIYRCASSFSEFVEGYLRDDPYVVFAPRTSEEYPWVP